MKIAIIGDVHFGANYNLGQKDSVTGLNTRLKDYSKTLERTIDEIVSDGCEEIIFTGDIFETRHPSVVQQKLFSQNLAYALNQGVKSIDVVIGNHDQQRAHDANTLSYLQELDLHNIKVHEDITWRKLEKNGVVVANLIFMPYRDRKWLGDDTYSDAIAKIKSSLTYILGEIDNQAPKIVIGHFAIEGTMFAEEYAELYGDNELYLPKSMFNEMDITIMGHVHTPYVLSDEPYIAYVGSMEKRGAFENHKKKYAIIDLQNKRVEYKDEPCREIYELKLDLSSQIYTDELMSKVTKEIDKFAQSTDLKDSIIKISISILAEDSRFLEPKQLEDYVKDKYKVEYCTPIKPLLFSSRQARDAHITEHSSDEEAFVRFIKNTMSEYEFIDEITGTGLDIIRLRK
jgi:exonuclease SbcD